MADIYRSEAGRLAVESQYKRVLERWPVSCDRIVVPTCQGDTFVIVSGDRHAPPLVLLHGSGTNSASWMRDVPVWASRYRVYAVDMIGEAGLSAPSRPPLDSPAYAEWLDDVAAGLGIEKASVVGISLGGWLALNFAVRRPERIMSLSLLSPSGMGRQNVNLLLKVAILRMCGTWGLLKSLQLVSGRAMTLPKPMVDALLVVFRHFRPRMQRIPRFTDAELASLKMPVQVVVGGDDALLDSRETRDRLEQCVPHARISYLENVGHVLPPQTAAIAEFLETVVRMPAATRADRVSA